jgi:hypothetical protein
MSRRTPTWACGDFEHHQSDHLCAACLTNFLAQGRDADDVCLPPRVQFGRGWFSVGATHWFGATDEMTFPSRDGRRLLAQTVCGTICDVTLAYAPRVGRECRKCVSVLRKLGFDVGPRGERHPTLDGKADRLH